jgi:hypothetical protein
MKPTTLYNHNSIGTATKPLIPNAEFRAMVESVNAGDADISKWTDKYSLEPFQKQLIEQKIKALTN